MLESKAILANQCAINVAAYLYYIEVKAKARLFDEAVFAESFARKLATVVFDYEDLIDLNLKDGTYPAVDFATSNGEVACQVTITGSSDKIETTLETFMMNDYDKNYKRLIFIILGDKQGSYESKKIAENSGSFDFNPYRDIYDLRQLYKIIVNEGAPDKLAALRDLIEQELGSNINSLLVGYNRTKDNLGRIISAHDVTATLGVRAMRHLGVDREMFCQVDRFNQSLTHEMAEFLANEFAVGINWVTGATNHIYDSMPDRVETSFWRRNLRDAYALVSKYHGAGQQLSVVMPVQLSFDDFQTPVSKAEIDKIKYNEDGAPSGREPYFFLVAKRQNAFSTDRYSWLANEPVQHSKIGVYLLFLAAEIWRMVSGRSTLINVLQPDYWDMQQVQRGEWLLIDLLRYQNVVRNHADYVFINKQTFTASNINALELGTLRSNLKDYVEKYQPKTPDGIPVPAVIQ